MRQYIILFIFNILTSFAFGQNYEGKVLYWVDYQNKTTHKYDTSLTIGLGDKEVFYIKNGDYLITGNGLKKEWILYKSSTNTIYEKYKNNDTLYTIDASINNDSILDTYRNRDKSTITETINGITTKKTVRQHEIVFRLDSTMEYFYYKKKYKIDSKFFTKYKYEHFGNFVSISHAIPLIRNYIVGNYNCHKEVETFLPEKLDDKIFEIPKNLIIKQK